MGQNFGFRISACEFLPAALCPLSSVVYPPNSDRRLAASLFFSVQSAICNLKSTLCSMLIEQPPPANTTGQLIAQDGGQE